VIKANINLIVVALSLLTLHGATAQSTSIYGGSGPGSLTSFADALREHGIDTSRPSLIAALNNSNPFVRSTAAAQLMANRDYLAEPAVEKVLSTETDINARIDIASALIGLDDPVGTKQLETLCSDPSQPENVTIKATQQLAMAHRSIQKPPSTEKCADRVLVVFDSDNGAFIRDTILLLLPGMYHNASKDKADHMIVIAQSMLGDPSTVTRMRAGEALAEMGSTSSIEVIRSTMEHESDPNTRRWLQRNLDTLQKLQQQAARATPANTPAQ